MRKKGGREDVRNEPQTVAIKVWFSFLILLSSLILIFFQFRQVQQNQ
jgi:hypothetical protein